MGATLINSGELNKAEKILNSLLAKINIVKGTVLNDLAVIDVKKGNINWGYEKLKNLVKRGYGTNAIYDNLIAVKKMISNARLNKS